MARISKTFPVFDCDAHINDYLYQWEKYYTAEDREIIGDSFSHTGEHALLNGKVLGGGRPLDQPFLMPGISTSKGTPRPSFIDFLGPGMNRETIRKLNHADLSPQQIEELAFKGSVSPLPRLEDMNQMGIDQVLVIPIHLLVSVQWVDNPRAADSVVRAYNTWVKQDYCDVQPDRLFPAAILPQTDVPFSVQELERVAREGFSVALIRPIDAQGDTYPNRPEFEPLWRTFEETGLVCGMHTVTGGQPQSGQYSPGELVDRAVSQLQIQGAGQTLSFIHEAMTWLTGVLLSGFLERYPKLKMAIFESNATWLPMVLEACDRLYHLYGSQRLPKLGGLPSEIFRERCLISFESDEDWVYRRWRRYEDIAIWSSDTYHHDGADAWEAIERMREIGVPETAQAKMLGGNARRFYGIEGKLFTEEQPQRYEQAERILAAIEHPSA